MILPGKVERLYILDLGLFDVGLKSRLKELAEGGERRNLDVGDSRRPGVKVWHATRRHHETLRDRRPVHRR